MHYVGIDLANRASAICELDADGKVLQEASVATEQADLELFLRRLAPSYVVVEASPLAEWTARVVEGCGHQVAIVEPRAAKRLAEVQKKTDPRDARTLAQLGRTGFFRPVHRKSESARLQRSQIQAREGLLETERAMDSRIRGLLRAHGIKVGKVSKGLFAERVRAQARAYCPELLPYLESLLTILEEARSNAKQLKKGMERQQRRSPVAARLQTTPGVGPLVSQSFCATVDDPNRFTNGDEVADYLGLTPGIYQSGDTEVRGRITKEGDRVLRSHLVEAATVLLTHGRDCALKRWGQRLAATKGVAKARVAVARKLAVLLWRLWQRGEVFQPFPEGAPEAA